KAAKAAKIYSVFFASFAASAFVRDVRLVDDGKSSAGARVRTDQSPDRHHTIRPSGFCDGPTRAVEHLPGCGAALVPGSAFGPGEEHPAFGVDGERRMLPGAIRTGARGDVRDLAVRRIDLAEVHLALRFPARQHARRAFRKGLRAHHARADLPPIDEGAREMASV